MLPRIYLAGPDVFLPDAAEMGDRKKRLCAKYGFEGVYPMDSEADLDGLSSRDAALRIGALNHDLIAGCDAVVAHVTPFRGPSADVGTVYEMGYGAGVGLIVCAYTNVAVDFTKRTAEFLRGNVHRASDGRLRDADGMAIENWQLVDNLMLESCVVRSGGHLVLHAAAADEVFTSLEGFEECLRLLR